MSEVLLADAIAGFLDSLRAAKKSDNTVSAYRGDLEAVAELLVGPVDKPVAEMRSADVTVAALRQAFGARASVSAAATMARTHSVWTRFFRFCRSEGLVAINPTEEIERAKIGTSRPRSIDTPHLARRLLTAAATPPPPKTSTRWPTRDTAIVATFMTTGIRLSELVGLNCGSLTGEDGAHQVYISGKGAKYRAIPALPGLVEHIRAYQTERRQRFPKHRLDRPKTPMFVHATSGERVTGRQIQYLFDRIYRQAGLRAQVPPGALVHALRHTFAMDLLDNGASIVEVQTLLGHESLATTRRYLTARPHELRNAIIATTTSAALRRSRPDQAPK